MSKAERTRQFIVEKTAPIFNVKGYAGTSVSDMTEATGLTKGSIYGNFENKDEVALAAFEHNWKGVQTAVRAEMDRRTTYKDKLLVFARVYENLQSPAFPRAAALCSTPPSKPMTPIPAFVQRRPPPSRPGRRTSWR